MVSAEQRQPEKGLSQNEVIQSQQFSNALQQLPQQRAKHSQLSAMQEQQPVQHLARPLHGSTNNKRHRIAAMIHKVLEL